MNTERHIPAARNPAVDVGSPAKAPRIEHDCPTVTGIPIAQRRTSGRSKSYLGALRRD